MIDNQTIGQRLNILLEQLEMGLNQFADSIGVDGSQFGKVVKDKMNITVKQLLEISSKYKVRTGWILEGEEPIYKNEESSAVETLDYNLLTLMKKQADDLQANFDLLVEQSPELSARIASQSQVFEDLGNEGKPKKAGKR